jgi:hemerythrin-like metal-binding protein
MTPDRERKDVASLALDHEALLQLFDGIIDAARSPGKATALEEALLRFAERLTDHVATEQELMRALRYPSTEPHVAEHDRLLEEVSDLLPRHGHGFSGDVMEGVRSLELAVQQHIITWDWNLLDFVARAGRPR